MSKQSVQSGASQIRIIGGEWRSRVIEFVAEPGVRPTPNRVRETVFNWLQFDVPGSRCLDLFSGSGALGFEAASRGARSVRQVEHNPHCVRQLQRNAQKLQAQQIEVIAADVVDYLRHTACAEPFDLVFLDPPFGADWLVPVCAALNDKHWLAPGAKIYLESEIAFDQQHLPSAWQMLKNKTAGEVRYALYHYAA
jgi:16S rRNA (guanine966-N2)-methyltransferase